MIVTRDAGIYVVLEMFSKVCSTKVGDFETMWAP